MQSGQKVALHCAQGADQEQSKLIQETGTPLNPNKRLEQMNRVCIKIYLHYPFPFFASSNQICFPKLPTSFFLRELCIQVDPRFVFLQGLQASSLYPSIANSFTPFKLCLRSSPSRKQIISLTLGERRMERGREGREGGKLLLQEFK